jgi:hypothetical protein
MVRFIIVSISSGILFGFLDGLINGNPYAQKLFECYKPIAKTSINIPLGVTIDIIYGFVMCWIFLIIYSSIPASSGLVKGILYGLALWFFRVLMSVITNYVMFEVPLKTLLYIAMTGLAEMVIIGSLYGLAIKPAS